MMIRFSFSAARCTLLLTGFLLGGLPGTSHAGTTLDKVKSSGKLSCGLISELEEYNKEDRHGALDALGGEICKAVAVAVLGDGAQVTTKTYPVELEALNGLAKAEVDLLVGVTPSVSNMAIHGVAFGPPVFYDGQGFMVDKAAGITSMQDLAGRKVCYIDGTEYQPVVDPIMQARHIAYLPYPFQEEGEMDAALVVRHCDAETADISKLADKRSGFHARAEDFVLLPEILTLDPVAPAYRQGDAQWAAIVDWTIYALIQAEASGITKDSVAHITKSDDLVAQHLLGIDYSTAVALGLDHPWAARVIAAVGNYGEIYDRTTGAASALDLPRGLNTLWTQGGLMRPLPVR